jgi:hypothetical protein
LVKVGNDSAATGIKKIFKITAWEELVCARLEGSGYSDKDETDDFGNRIGERLAGVTFIKATKI